MNEEFNLTLEFCNVVLLYEYVNNRLFSVLVKNMIHIEIWTGIDFLPANYILI